MNEGYFFQKMSLLHSCIVVTESLLALFGSKFTKRPQFTMSRNLLLTMRKLHKLNCNQTHWQLVRYNDVIEYWKIGNDSSDYDPRCCQVCKCLGVFVKQPQYAVLLSNNIQILHQLSLFRNYFVNLMLFH
ncbi:uncharacterized protein PHALS_15292 [Plasmopara halstedii]|uniref:Uncharacterized protein n=1 Tax=Plasmopara halstedii TaxID=4781 RepID=A0A0P1ATD4_PLAHL|nr:uncharacterized protein PHALS_15292 [Plasmopara halstedii]CEG44530.1 hypothetical protein PHALS_15292 [Plasmopara halstedii]|eukprot:XP_024580899.1 hypothetical protein PHALS_15292 [Plasmopara halstedii]